MMNLSVNNTFRDETLLRQDASLCDQSQPPSLSVSLIVILNTTLIFVQNLHQADFVRDQIDRR